LNPRHTGYAGYPLPITPNLDGFLKENVAFTDCYTPIARTFPAWYSILTGQYPRTSGVRLNLTKRKNIKSAGQGLGHVLTGLGYSTSHFTDEVRFSNITRGEGFRRLRHLPMGVKDFLFGSLHDFSLTNVFFNNPLGYVLFPFLDVNRAVAHLYDGRYFVNDLVSATAKLRRERRFFLAVHLCIAHWPYVHASPRDIGRRPGADPLMPLYDSAVSKVDDQFRRIIGALKANGLYDDSLLVVFSDHGESAEGHGSDLRDLAQNRVLLAWKPPGPPVHREIGALSGRSSPDRPRLPGRRPPPLSLRRPEPEALDNGDRGPVRQGSRVRHHGDRVLPGHAGRDRALPAIPHRAGQQVLRVRPGRSDHRPRRFPRHPGPPPEPGHPDPGLDAGL
jgi:arylsulfatase A-like enzyme